MAMTHVADAGTRKLALVSEESVMQSGTDFLRIPHSGAGQNSVLFSARIWY